MQNLKYIKYFKNYIAEQDFGAMEDPMAAAAQAAPVEKIHAFIFIEDGDEGDYTYPDGSSSKRYPTYEITETDLNKWLDKLFDGEELAKSAADVKKQALKEYIIGEKSGVTPDDKKYVEKFKNAVETEIEGSKKEDTEVLFHPDEDVPTTDSIEVTFITTPK